MSLNSVVVESVNSPACALAAKKRHSGIELLRILSMLMVLVHHANYWRIGRPDAISIMCDPLASFVRIATQTFADPCVDVFIIISGYFSIRPKLKSIMNLWFLLSFWACVTIVWEGAFNAHKLLFVVFPFWGWFIPAYLGLYMVSPILNSYCENDKRNLLKFLIYFFLLQFVFDFIYPGWSIFGRTIFNGGRSILSFSGLYLLGRWLRDNTDWLEKVRARFYWGGYVGIFLVSSLIQFICFRWISGPRVLVDVLGSTGRNSHLITIIGSTFLFLAFLKLKNIPIKLGLLINHVSISVLAIFCFHALPFYEEMVKRIFAEYSGVKVLLLDLALILGVVVVAVAIDQIRIGAWKLVCANARKTFLNIGIDCFKV